MNGLIFEGTPIFARLVWGGDVFKPGPFYLGRWSKFVSWAALAYMTFMIVILCFPGTPDPTADTMNYGSVVFAGTIFFSLAYYFCPKYGARYWFTYVSFCRVRSFLVDLYILCSRKLLRRWWRLYNMTTRFRRRRGNSLMLLIIMGLDVNILRQSQCNTKWYVQVL